MWLFYLLIIPTIFMSHAQKVYHDGSAQFSYGEARYSIHSAAQIRTGYKNELLRVSRRRVRATRRVCKSKVTARLRARGIRLHLSAAGAKPVKRCVQRTQRRIPARIPTPTPVIPPAIVNPPEIILIPTPVPVTSPDPLPVPPLPVPPLPVPPLAAPLLPAVAQWEKNMKSWGLTNCTSLQGTGVTFDERLAATYYDGIWVYQQIADYTGDASWLPCIQAAKNAYRDAYVVPNGGLVPGYWNFSHGLTQDFLRTGDAVSKSSELLLSEHAAYAADTTPSSWTDSADLSREVSYALMSYLNAELLGAPRRPRLASLVDQALGHVHQWFVARNAKFVRPFMVSLTAHALISYDTQVGDARVLPALELAANELWRTLWNPSQRAFLYTDRSTDTGGTELAPDLNLLIAPMYGWLYMKTGNPLYREMGDAIFTGGVQGAWLANGKQFNQNYRWSFAYLKWRGGSAPLKSADAEETGNRVQLPCSTRAIRRKECAKSPLYHTRSQRMQVRSHARLKILPRR